VGLAGGLETELTLVVDAMFPVSVLASAVAAFQVQFPAIPLRLYVEMWEAVADPVLDPRWFRHSTHWQLPARRFQ
jgi:hypothetical protein